MSNFLINNTRMTLAKNKPKLSNNLKLDKNRSYKTISLSVSMTLYD